MSSRRDIGCVAERRRRPVVHVRRRRASDPAARRRARRARGRPRLPASPRRGPGSSRAPRRRAHRPPAEAEAEAAADCAEGDALRTASAHARRTETPQERAPQPRCSGPSRKIFSSLLSNHRSPRRNASRSRPFGRREKRSTRDQTRRAAKRRKRGAERARGATRCAAAGERCDESGIRQVARGRGGRRERGGDVRLKRRRRLLGRRKAAASRGGIPRSVPSHAAARRRTGHRADRRLPRRPREREGRHRNEQRRESRGGASKAKRACRDGTPSSGRLTQTPAEYS